MEEVKKYTKAQRTKESILQAAMKLMKERGFIDTTIRDICAAAGVSIGTFYTYFPSKQDIFADLFNAADDLFCNTVAADVKGNTVCEKIVDYFRYYARLNLDSGIEIMKVVYNSENTWFIKTRPMHHVLTNLIKEGQQNGELVDDADPDDVTFFFYTMARGCCYSWCIRNGKYDLEAQLADYISRALTIYTVKK